ncbi:hypothetical protein [Novosphingobium chloroacetimidivorans]|uniref:hypothetical protein n=1 Tax=Novosphingobium chloroacetimidivorans TaxID=1428314 RepID=UPI001C86DB44|nr:hypothetical protein [Novosphingobium chloroacetimidivorans]
MTGDDDVPSNQFVWQMDQRIRKLRCQLGRKTMKVKILKEATDKARKKIANIAHALVLAGRKAVKANAQTLTASRSAVQERLTGL